MPISRKRLKHFQQNCAAVLRPEKRQNKKGEYFRISGKGGNTLEVSAKRSPSGEIYVRNCRNCRNPARC
ncbi:hypothetical protein CFBP5877_07580 [Agrobacterium tumefaciens]|uniref:Uncharacterized protein n=1 Tax=Agrobacterium tumefaciens TaxID=358 RepID=A0AAE6EER7_AGRTU|nr:hypothetical protein CFBP5499_08050 [Agrobacterium tumefaciens]QCL78947.1 hypothetical protein CFBP5877_07580 [Agrobacterium tumefaciens]